MRWRRPLTGQACRRRPPWLGLALVAVLLVAAALALPGLLPGTLP
ncbi:MAG TPA: hypothetical protein VF058_11940 [Actinomycetota bacterium]